jgi:hypothetical protein
MRFPALKIAVGYALAASMLAVAADPAAARSSHHRSKHKRAEVAKKEKLELPKGTLQIVVSIGDQRVTVYSDGVPFAQAPVSSGTRSHPTPMGVFSIIQKRRFHRSNIYSNAPMPFMQRLTWSGIALHAGVLPGYPASHGCIRLPNAFAQKLWRYTRIGARVIVARNDVPPQEIAHPNLFASIVKPAVSDKSSATPQPASAVMTAQTVDPTKASDAPGPAAAKSGETEFAFSAAELNQFNASEPIVPVGPVAVFVSRRTGKLHVRKGTVPMFESPVVIRDPDRPFGTHIFTAMAATDDGAGMRWTAQTLPPEPPRQAKRHTTTGKKLRKNRKHEPEPVKQAEPTPSPAEVLGRIQMPADVVQRIEKWLSPGSSLMVSDHRMSEETGEYTDFIVVTR